MAKEKEKTITVSVTIDGHTTDAQVSESVATNHPSGVVETVTQLARQAAVDYASSRNVDAEEESE